MANNYVNDYKIFMRTEDGEDIPLEIPEITDWSEIISDEVIEAWHGFPFGVHEYSVTVHADNETCLEFANMMLELENIELERQIAELKKKMHTAGKHIASLNGWSVGDPITANHFNSVLQAAIDELS